MNEACRINKPMAYERPTPELRGAGGQNQGETGQGATPRPLERRVGRRTRKEWPCSLPFDLSALNHLQVTSCRADTGM